MSNNNLCTIQLREKEVYYLRENGENFVLIRPICEAFELDADRQIRNLKDDEFLAPEVSEQTTQVPTDIQRRAHTCLPEKLIYGWLMGIKFTNTMSAETKAYLTAYKRECYEVLYNHFHGRFSEADRLLKEKALVQKEINELRTKLLNQSDIYKQLLDKEAQLRSFGNPYTRVGNKISKEISEELFATMPEAGLN